MLKRHPSRRYAPVHGGQVSLPGGALNPGETAAEAALREFHEDLGAVGHPIRLLGRLSLIYVHASNFAGYNEIPLRKRGKM
jgi:8-oxo-dGTP pyrophosphatase MutT (NUDIX family)